MGRLSEARDKRDRIRAGIREQEKQTHQPGHQKAARRRLEELRAKLDAVLKRIRKFIRRRRLVRWPDIDLVELLYHDPPHVHVASPQRDRLIQLARIGQKKYSLRIGEFPPFDVVEPVHISGSWHYRDSSIPWTPRNFSDRGNGLAFDANDADGGSDGERAFYAELVRRYR